MTPRHACENPRKATRRTTPGLPDIQSELLEKLHTIVAVPLCSGHSAVPAAMQDHCFVVRVLPVTTTDRKHPGRRVADLSACRTETVAALDVLIPGVYPQMGRTHFAMRPHQNKDVS